MCRDNLLINVDDLLLLATVYFSLHLQSKVTSFVCALKYFSYLDYSSFKGALPQECNVFKLREFT